MLLSSTWVGQGRNRKYIDLLLPEKYFFYWNAFEGFLQTAKCIIVTIINNFVTSKYP